MAPRFRSAPGMSARPRQKSLTRVRVVAGVCARAVGAFACSGDGDDDPIVQPSSGGGVDAPAGDAATDAASDATTDAPIDAPVNAAELSIALGDSPDPVAASATLTYTLDV